MIITLVVAPAPVVLASQPCPDPSTGPSISAFPQETLCSLGVLSGGSYSAAAAVSTDGTVIVGSGEDDSGFAAVRWVSGAIQTLGVLPGDWSSEALGVGGDNRVIVGYSDSGQVQSAVRWTDGVIQPLAALPGRRNSKAYGVNADGSAIVGKSGDYAVRWVNGVIQKLETLSGGQHSKAYGVNADGSVIVGKSGDYAVRWVNGVIQKLDGPRAAVAVSADGRVIVGDGSYNAVQWTDGVPQDLGTLPGGTYSAAVAVSADGRVVVGNGDGPGKYESHAIRWENGVPQDLGTLPGGTDSYAYGVSADGSVVVGDSQSANGHRAFVWKKTPPPAPPPAPPVKTDPADRLSPIMKLWKTMLLRETRPQPLPPPSRVSDSENTGVMQDLVNLKRSFAQLADDGDISRSHMERRAELASDQTCLAASGENCLRVALASDFAGANENIGERSAMSGLFSFGRGLGRNNGTTLGATLGGSGSPMGGNAFDMDTGPAVALWAEHSEFGLSRVGWQVSGSIGWAGASGKATRGDGIFGVIPTTGKTDMDTRIVRASLGYGFGTRTGYGFRHNGGWLLTPTVGLAHYLAHRNGYAETGDGFTAAYDQQTTRRTLLTLAVSAKTGIGDLGSLSLAGGVRHDLSRDDTVLSGTSDVPGRERFAIKSALDRNDTWPFVSVGYSRPVGPGGTLSATVGVATPEFGDTQQLGMSISYSVRF